MMDPREITVAVAVPWAPGVRHAVVQHAVVRHTWRMPDETQGLIRWEACDGPTRGACLLEDEGTTWARGWLASDTPEARALLAAHALAQMAV